MATTKVAPAKAIEAAKEKNDLSSRSVARKVCESELYDLKPTGQFLLNQIAVMAMNDEDDNYPEGAPDEYQADKIGWCWLSQFTLGLRVGISEGQVCKWIKRFREDGVIYYRDWRDEWGTLHAEYKVVESVVDAHQRNSQKRDAKRPTRYKTKRHANATSFSTKNQPKRSVIEDEDDA